MSYIDITEALDGKMSTGWKKSRTKNISPRCSPIN